MSVGAAVIMTSVAEPFITVQCEAQGASFSGLADSPFVIPSSPAQTGLSLTSFMMSQFVYEFQLRVDITLRLPL